MGAAPSTNQACTRMPPSFPDVRAISALDDDTFASVLQCTVDACSGHPSEQEFSRAARGAMKTIVNALSFATRCSLSATQLRDEVIGQGVTTARGELLAAAFQQNIELLATCMTDRTLMANQVVDVEWSFGVTASN